MNIYIIILFGIMIGSLLLEHKYQKIVLAFLCVVFVILIFSHFTSKNDIYDNKTTTQTTIQSVYK